MRPRLSSGTHTKTNPDQKEGKKLFELILPVCDQKKATKPILWPFKKVAKKS